MEDELFAALYPLVVQEATRRPRPKRVRYGDDWVLLVAFWAVLHDRPVCWACRARHWPARFDWLALPSPTTMSVRLRTASVQLLLEQVFYRLLGAVALAESCLCRRVDAKPLPVGGFSKDRDARRGYATGGTARGYKLFGCWGRGVVPDAVVLGPMNESDPAGAMHLIDELDRTRHGAAGGYLLMDSTHDTNPLHDHAGARGFQAVTPRKEPGTGLGHRTHALHRLRSIELLEGPSDPYAFALSGAARGFGRRLYALRGQVERDYGQMGSFGGGLQPLPNFVRRPRRVALWVIAKLIINGLRICRNQGLTA